MRVLFLMALTLVLGLPGESSARIYKCEIDGVVAYSGKPCPEKAVSMEMAPETSPTPENRVDGDAGPEMRSMVVQDAVALRQVQGRHQEVHVYLYPAKLTAEALAKIRDSGCDAPDPTNLGVAPIVVLQFVLKDPREPITLENIRHWRFVSWMNQEPSVLDKEESSLKDSFQLVQESYDGNGASLRLKTHFQQTFADSVLGWNLDVTVPVIHPNS